MTQLQHILDTEAIMLAEIDRNHGIMPVALANGRAVNTRRRYAARNLEAKGEIRIIRSAGNHRLYMARPDQADQWEAKLRAWEKAGGTGIHPDFLPTTTPGATQAAPAAAGTGEGHGKPERRPIPLAQAMIEALSRPVQPRPAPAATPTARYRKGRNPWTPRQPLGTDDALIGQNLSRLLSGHDEETIVTAMRARGIDWTTWTLRNTEQGSRRLRLIEAVALARILRIDTGTCLAWLLNSVQGLGTPAPATTPHTPTPRR